MRFRLRDCARCGSVLIFLLSALSALAAEGPSLRTGLWMTQKISDVAADPGRLESAIRANTHLSGICLTAGWSDIQKEPDKIDFSQIDQAVSLMRRLHMKYELGVKPGIDTPAFIYKEGAQQVQTRISNPHRADAGEAAAVPVPWDGIYQKHFSHMIAQLGERYSSDPLCVSVVLTCANFMSKEMHLPKTPEAKQKWEAMGDYSGKLVQVYKKYADEWAKAFPKQQVSLHISQVLDLPASFFEKIIDYGLDKYPERFTIQNCQLSGRKEDDGSLSYDLVQKYRDRAHHGFQSVAGFSGGGERMGSIEMAALNVVHAGGEYWEIWHGDGMNAQTSAAIANAWDEARKLGYDGYKQKLIAAGLYQEQQGKSHRGRRRG